MAKFIDASGATQEVDITLDTVRAAADAGVSLREAINTQYGTDTSKFGEVFAQMCASEGIVFNPSKVNGIKAPKLDALLSGPQMQAGVITGNSNPSNQARVLLMPAVLALVEDKLLGNLSMNPAAFDKMVGSDTSISGDWALWPISNYSRPEAARSQRIAQLAAPTSMLTLTTSEKSVRIPTVSLGVEWSDQAAKIMGLDYVAMSIARQAMIEKNETANAHLLAMLNGDVDTGDAALTAPRVATAQSYDSTITTAGVLTQQAWMKHLYKDSTKKTITHVVTDINGALALEGRTGKPVITGDNPNSARIDTLPLVMNPGWGPTVQVFITDDVNWPANTLMCLDSSAAIMRISSLSSSYSASEDFVLRRASAMRMDYGQIAKRWFDDAFSVLTLTV